MVGPLAVPGAPCWNCTRLRLLGTSDAAEIEHELHARLLYERPPSRDRACLSTMPALVGGVLTTDAIALLSGYSQARLIGRVLVFDVKSFETTFHTVVPMPWCVVCGGAAKAKDVRIGSPGGVLAEAADPEALRTALAGWIDERVGVVKFASISSHDVTEPQLPVTATALLARYTEGVYRAEDPEHGSGKGLTRVEALLGAVGEAVERYSASRYRLEDLRRSPFDDLEVSAMDPRDLVLYEDHLYEEADFPFARFSPDIPISWCRASWLHGGDEVLVPALPAYFNFHAPRAERFCQVTSNGLAAGASLEDAGLRAVWELVERDAFMITWLARLPATRIDITSLGADPALGEILRQLRECGAAVEVYRLEAGIEIPVILTLGLGDGARWPAATVALAAHQDGPTAVRKALLEQGHVGPYVRRLMRSGEIPIPESPEEVRTLNDHALYYVPPSRQTAFDFLRSGANTMGVDELPACASPSLARSERALTKA
ncbi:MAG TPA: TOMM precursor leader peptide-binding protein, partial [Thermoanaerobaculia bacterium]